jgi:transposase
LPKEIWQPKRFLKKLQEKLTSDDYEIFYQDEVHFKMNLSIIRAWFLKGTKPEIKSPTDRFKLSAFGALSRQGQLITLQTKVFNALTFKTFLEKLLWEAKVGYNKKGKRKKILLVLDNAKYHHAKLLQPWLEEVKDILELCFLPAYSPELNAIERFWKKTRRNVTHNRFFISLDNLAYDLKMYWNQFKDQNQELEKLSVNI